MRLIDAETAKEMLMRVIFGADRKIDAWVDAMPAVDAIPVEWLEKLFEDDGDWNEEEDLINWTIRRWKQEQEARS